LDQLLILDKPSGKVISNISLSGPVLSGIKKYKDFLYMIVEDEGLIAFNHNTKEIKWKIGLSRYSSRANRIIVDEDRIYFSDNNLHAVNRSDGSIVWEIGEKEGVFIRDSGLSQVKEFLIFYVFEHNENLLTVADKNTGEILYQGFNSNVVGGDSNNPDGVAKEDLLLIDFMDELIDDNILIGVMDNKIYGLEILK
jgi:outer membrane protein assembly factor BamB